ncbi:GntR family transcriptional regulator [Marasmitruncus massiliensis]|uniref:GntR family transcriptional regulator n=1 Tax=Marasmitruncus massiliensis TaxID=1944642 RepID=UPI000C7C6777|nr:GntR family transcriptional regulator [Marasmitruncus massiliensis]
MPSTADMAAQTIRARIMSGELRPGEKLREVELCKQLEISRTPLREAFRILQSEGFLTYQSNSGVVVATLSMGYVIKLQEIRYALEPISARYAALHITPDQIRELRTINEKLYTQGQIDPKVTPELDIEFHTLIAQSTNNPAILEYLLELYRKTSMQRRLLPIRPDRLSHTYKEHNDIIYALELGDPELAVRYVSIHFYVGQHSFNKKVDEYLNQKGVDSEHKTNA